MPDFPSIFEQARNVVVTSYDIVKAATQGKAILVPEEVARERFNLCTTCPLYQHPKCAKCGCVMPIKVQAAQSTCPDDRWGKWE